MKWLSPNSSDSLQKPSRFLPSEVVTHSRPKRYLAVCVCLGVIAVCGGCTKQSTDRLVAGPETSEAETISAGEYFDAVDETVECLENLGLLVEVHEGTVEPMVFLDFAVDEGQETLPIERCLSSILEPAEEAFFESLIEASGQ